MYIYFISFIFHPLNTHALNFLLFNKLISFFFSLKNLQFRCDVMLLWLLYLSFNSIRFGCTYIFFLIFLFFPQASTNSGANERASRCDGRMRNNREKAKARQTRVVTVQQQQKQCKQMFAECNNRCQNVFKV